MGIFNHINPDKLNELRNLFSNCNHDCKPILNQNENEVLASNNTEAKAQLLFQVIVAWQSSLNEARTDVKSQDTILKDANKYAAMTESQSAVNKLKRKFNKLFLEGFSDADKEALAKKLLQTFHSPCTQVNFDFSIFVVENFGFNEYCFKFFSKYLGHSLVFPAKSHHEILDVSRFKLNEHPPLQFNMTAASVTARVPISNNTWNHFSKENSSFTQYSIEVLNATKSRRKEARAKHVAIVENIKSRSCWSKKLGLSDFKREMTYAKLENGQLIQNCGEMTGQFFHDFTRKRTFDTVAICFIEKQEGADESHKGDHGFNYAKSADDPRKFFVDIWNGAKLYLANEHELHLRDYKGMFANGSPITRPFDLKTQYIKMTTYNIYPLEEFKNRSPSKHPGLIQLLKGFHEIPTLNREAKMLKALQIITFIENEMPLYEVYDKAVHDLYDQMMYLTAKERKKGLRYTPGKLEKLYPIDQALKDLNKVALKKVLSGNKKNIKTSPTTILHAIKAAMISENMEFYEWVAELKLPVMPLPVFTMFDARPDVGLEKLTEDMFTELRALHSSQQTAGSKRSGSSEDSRAAKRPRLPSDASTLLHSGEMSIQTAVLDDDFLWFGCEEAQFVEPTPPPTNPNHSVPSSSIGTETTEERCWRELVEELLDSIQ